MANEFKIKKGLIVTGADGGTVVDIQGSQGQLFSVTDDLSGSIFAVSDISGVPILDVNSSGLVTVDGPFTQTGGGATILSGTLNVEGVSTLANVGYLGDGLGSVQYTFQSANDGFATIDFGDVADSNIGRLSYSHVDNSFLIRTNNATALTLDSSQNATFTGDVLVEDNIYLTDAGTVRAKLLLNASDRDNVELRAESLGSTMKFFTAATEALELDASQNAIFGGNVIVTGNAVNSDVTITSAELALLQLEDIGLNKTYNIELGRSSTAGDLTFRSTSGEKVRFTEAGNVGIGTDSPDYKLDVEGDISLVGAGENYAIMSPISQGMQIAVGDPAAIATPLVTFDGGYQRVGIGTTSPVNGKLVIDSTANQIAIETGTAGDGRLNIGHFSNGTFIGTYGDDGGAADLIRFGTHSGDEKMRITSSGNVGINETSPGVKLQLVSADEQLTNFSSSVADQLAYSQINANGTSTSGVITGAAALEFVGRANASGHGRHAWIGAEGTPNTSTKTKLKFKIRGETASGYDWAGAAEAPTIMTLEGDGNVGIGTTSPGAKLDVNSSISSSSADVIKLSQNTNGAVKAAASLGLSIQNGGEATNAADLWFTTATNGSLAERMRIKSSGNVGIGTTSPDEKLSVDGNILLQGNDDYIAFNTSASSGHPKIKMNSDADFSFLNTAGSNIFHIENGGDVGIGTTSPDFKLQIATPGITSGSTYSWPFDLTRAGISSTRGFSIGVGVAGGNVALGNHNGDMSLGQTFGVDSNNLPVFYETMRISHDGTASSGKVGIGTTVPGATLDVDGSIRLSTSGKIEGRAYPYTTNIGSSANATTTNITAGSTDKSEISLIGGDVGDRIEFKTNSTERMRIDSSGNVGIGTTTPNAKLDVQGTQGQLFSVTDDLSGDIFSVADISGVPIMNVNSDGTSYFDGNVGIGTDSPGAKLEVLGNIILRQSASNSETVYIATNDRGGGTADADLRLGNSNNGDVLTVHNANVGIGTINPASKLHVFGGSANTELKVTTNDNYIARLGLYEEEPGNLHGGFIQYRGESGDRLEIGSRNSGTDTVHMSIDDTTGYVGIGTTAPGAKLDVTAGASSVWMKLTNANESSFNLTTYNNGTGNGTSAYAFKHGLYYNTTENAAVTFYRGGSSVGGFLTFTTNNGAERMRITSAGNVGIGTTSPSYPLVVDGEIDASGDGYLINGSGWATESSDILTLGDWDGNEFSTRIMDQWSNEVLRVTDGRVGIGTTGPLATLHVDNPQTANGNIGFILDAAAGGTGTRNMHISLPDYGEGIRFVRSGTYSGGAMKFYSGTSNVGGVQINASSTSFNTTSDYRAKENVVPMENSINRLKELKPCRFNFIIEPENTVDGFIAHEAQEVVPEAVTGEKDKLNYEGSPEYQGIDQSKIVPLLTSALQEAISKIEQLETRIQTLENN